MHVRAATSAPPGWDAFVGAHPEATPFHLAAWSRCVARGLGAEPLHVWAERDGQVVGVLPLHHVRSRLFGARLASTPQAAYGGPLAADDEIAARLVEHAVDEAERRAVRYLELRMVRAPGQACDGERWCASDLRVTLGGPIANDDDGILKAIPKKTRADCRKADEALAAEEAPGLFGEFHALFAENQHSLGTPVLPRRFLAMVAECADLAPRILVVRDADRRAVAACLSFRHRERILPYYAGAARDALHLRPNHGLYLNVLRFARREGCTYYDFGRSKRGSGSYDFKRRWGFDETELAYRYRLVRATEMPALNPQNPRYQRKIEAWKRLPHWAANLLGPLLSPGLS